jgi:hypothetical protein
MLIHGTQYIYRKIKCIGNIWYNKSFI